MKWSRILHLYRPRLPGQRAQAIQVVHACHALARLGHTVTLLADRGGAGDPLAALGLAAAPGLDIRIAPVAHPGLAGLWFRRQLSRWWSGPPGVVLARDKRRLAAALERHAPRHGRRGHRVIIETHELDSALAAEAGRDAAPVAALERGLAEAADGLIANCGGTLAAWEAAHGGVLPRNRRVCHNAAGPDRTRADAPTDDVIRVLGSLRPTKRPEILLQATLPLPLEMIGGTDAERAALSPPPGVRLLAPVPYPAVPDLLATARVLILPLGGNLFGRSLTSPLKLWDYLATDRPVVAPDLPTVREIAALTGVRLFLHRPDDPGDLTAAVSRALDAPRRTPFVRTWLERAREVAVILKGGEILEGGEPT